MVDNRAPLNLPAANAAEPEPSAQDRLTSCVSELTETVNDVISFTTGHKLPKTKGCAAEASIDDEEHEVEGGNSTIAMKFKQVNENIARLNRPSPRGLCQAS